MEFSAEILKRFLRDPVLAAYAITGIELDWFQSARLRYLWFVPEKVDSSGWSTGKTICEWLYGTLRCTLLPNQSVGVYYPIFQTGKDEFWSKYFDNIQHPVLQAQYREGKSEWHDPGCWRKEFKNGSIMSLPAPGFLGDAKNQASRRFNTLIVGEYTQAAVKGEGVDELIGRNSAPSWSQTHPIYRNHLLLSAHAESPTHPSYKYVKAAKDAIRGQYSVREALDNVMVSFCYLDWSDRPLDRKRPEVTFRKKFRVDGNIRKSKRTLSKDEFRRRLLGLDAADGRGFYAEEVLKLLWRSDVRPMLERQRSSDIFTLGVDIAPGQSLKADECAFLVWMMRKVPSTDLWSLMHLGQPHLICPVFAWSMKNVDAGQISGFIHGLHRSFGFSRIAMDPGGGGAWVYKELIKQNQLIHNAMTRVLPLCTTDEPITSDKQPIVVFMKRGNELDKLWPKSHLQSDDGMVEAMHRRYREATEGAEYLLPMPAEHRAVGEMRGWTETERQVQNQLDQFRQQLIDVRMKTDPEGRPLMSRRGFWMFEAKSGKKKDKAYAGIYGHTAMRLLLTDETGGGGDGGDDVGV